MNNDYLIDIIVYDEESILLLLGDTKQVLSFGLFEIENRNGNFCS